MSQYLGGGIYSITEEQKQEYFDFVERIVNEGDDDLTENELRQYAAELAYEKCGICPDCEGW